MHLTIPLRFRKADARVLRNHALWCAGNGISEVDVSLFIHAANAAASGEPLQVTCEHPREVEQMADLFTQLGIKRPAIG